MYNCPYIVSAIDKSPLTFHVHRPVHHIVNVFVDIRDAVDVNGPRGTRLREAGGAAGRIRVPLQLIWERFD
jgi:hypothetical protein